MNVPDKQFNAVALAGVDIDILKTFIAIAETGSFSKAANRVFRTPSAVSMQIKKLEDVLGASVLQRDSRSVELTQDGEMLLSYARRIIALSNEMMARFLMPDIEGSVVLGAPDDYGNKLLPAVLKRFAETHPNVCVDVVMDSSANLRERFERGELDVVVYTSSDKHVMEDGAHVVLEEDLVWAGLKGGCAYEKDPLPVSMWESGCAWRAGAVEALDKIGRSYRLAYKSAQVVAQRAAVSADLAVAPMPASFIEPPLIELTLKKHGLPPLTKYQIRMRLKSNAGCCSQAVADHVIACFDEL
ncbi:MULTISPECIES: LysR family transcriptional regulator [Ahrensia]|uniref:LysR family transcriptional regulator n=1 Tax=Ahrensia kielensis TaxID=76980 RepID=A0ABU9T6Y3_9HYPH|nr:MULTISPECIES: LysR family transcriptional regulator [Ahrensia]